MQREEPGQRRASLATELLAEGQGVVGKRKERDDGEYSQGQSKSKRPLLSDAFLALSIDKRSQQARGRSFSITIQLTSGDLDMRDPASFDKDKHTVVIQSLEEELRDITQEEQEQEPAYIFNLPEGIDKMFAGRKAMPSDAGYKISEMGPPEASQLVLYNGRPDEVISRSLQGTRNMGHVAEKEPDEMSISDAADTMELD
ncbi:hypothetical protein BCR37DRAFT_393763 [Protomyces lactucae-debilis]|uniref:Uncharacterized protein n=1 Tax=Protomyces lactucae-debilis TaxID=2754530 RepID=A0A1Y2F957_PROLT|nr:uncharacterized protein BCR37DRAFT_393763 [Protomyces lactucae-debilis]ORY80403.1 hypothetical protein BCR37DRAFT_393763 [Protomyces lactucae-debilis]